MKSRLVSHVAALLFCVGLPAAFTALAPVATIDFERAGPGVAVKVTSYLLFIIPYRRQALPEVNRISDEFRRGKTYVETVERNGRQVRETRRNDDEAYLVLAGYGQSIRLPVSPANIQTVRQRAEQFLAEPEPPAMRLRTVPNWKFSVLAGGVLSLLTLIYLGVLVWKWVRYPIRLMLTTPGQHEASI